MIDSLLKAHSNMQTHYDKETGARDLLQKQLSDKEALLLKVKADIATWEQVQTLFTKVSDFAREQIKSRIEATVTAALTAVFGEGYTFKINMRTVGGQASAEWQVVSQYGDVEVAASPEDARGGGIVDMCSLALRLAMLELIRPRVEGPVVLDEPSKMVSREYLPNLAFFLKQYAAKANRQILMVTHSEVLAEAADKAYMVTQRDGCSEVKEI